MMLANTPCPISDTRTGKLLMGKAAMSKYKENPSLYVVGYELDPQFWDTLLRVGEEDIDEVEQADAGPKLSLSDRFRTSKRPRDKRSRNINDGSTKD